MKRMMIAGLCASIACWPVHAATYIYSQQQGVINVTRHYTALHPNAAARGTTVFQFTTPLEGGCSWLFLDGSDPTAQRLVAKGAAITVFYDNTISSPWGDTTVCGVIGIQVGSD
jgi:hypothetical protein